MVDLVGNSNNEHINTSSCSVGRRDWRVPRRCGRGLHPGSWRVSTQNPARVEAGVPTTMTQHARVAATDRHGEDVQPLRTPRCHGRLVDNCVWVRSSAPIVHARHRVVGAVAAKLTVHICVFYFTDAFRLKTSIRPGPQDALAGPPLKMPIEPGVARFPQSTQPGLVPTMGQFKYGVWSP